MNDKVIDVPAALLEALTDIQQGLSAGAAPSVGICNAVRARLSVEVRRMDNPCWMTLLTKLAADWPEYSGDSMYPVPANTPGFSASTIYPQMKAAGLLWDRGHQYGRARRRLLAFMIQKLNEGAQT